MDSETIFSELDLENADYDISSPNLDSFPISANSDPEMVDIDSYLGGQPLTDLIIESDPDPVFRQDGVAVDSAIDQVDSIIPRTYDQELVSVGPDNSTIEAFQLLSGTCAGFVII